MSTTDIFSVSGRTAVVTGAGGQLGRSFVTALADAGANVVATDASPGPGVIEMDVTDAGEVQRTLAKVADRHDGIDILVNNAGVGVFTSLELRTEEELDRVISVNLRGVINCVRYARPFLRGGSVVNIASIYGVLSPDPRIYGDSGRNSAEIYGATKAGVVQLTRWFAVHLADDRIRVNSISPGGIVHEQGETFVASYSARVPLGRMAETGDLHGALIYLCSDASKYVTGHNLVVDGGLSAW